jgi:hypothetical protein
MNLKPAETLAQGGWSNRARGTINRWFDELSGLFARVSPEMLWRMSEVMDPAGSSAP